jgi:hypothetical protein
MSDPDNSGTGYSTGFAGLLTIVLITLKLLHKIDCSWWWVLSPIWLAAVVTLLIAVVFLAIAKALA